MAKSNHVREEIINIIALNIERPFPREYDPAVISELRRIKVKYKSSGRIRIISFTKRV